MVFLVFHWTQGCQIFLGKTYQYGEEYSKLSHNIPKGNKVYQTAERDSKWPPIVVFFFIPRPSKILEIIGILGV
jgi:hypothetical protein